MKIEDLSYKQKDELAATYAGIAAQERLQSSLDGGSMATAMGHSYETHCREYPWATKSGTDSAFARVKAA
ncbi:MULTISPECIES: hypothetical protein [Prochlorococcus]|uniref:Uncharacterized protein n=1 Tax=Prochlorococcus marinus (strain SARG / CCMP1375 / SS120) TaxID=167539 RepID=Q7VCX2_PROMA|nr:MULTISPECIES: hypothetical protein [Prochlorococcus]AAP99662.1 Predicted protein [Prochlorococcus marinus subsp. marinus str. CCMP1375]KGG13447.1 hypothetical protein EV04_0682 [Prochlorococcus marinus str. LG]KGG21309.1 hypothetical protein EV08_0717 [Prochlorococcus marinus str. SS2]KGG24360.1 hypothetical protein EV09_0407 [Prochlorococcus marinus str. SS35]KGG36441.1 hypothetical protein EV11_0813 [Prochlorococcus sp. SS52]